MPKQNMPHDTAFFDQLRSGFEYVASSADHVKINQEKLEVFAQKVAAFPIPDAFDEDHHFVSGKAEDDFGYVLLLDSVNFGSGYNSALRKEGTLQDGCGFYFTMAARLKERFDAAPITPTQAAMLSLRNVKDIFGFVAGDKSHELAELYQSALNEMGRVIADGYGQYEGYIKAMNADVGQCVSMLTQQSKFNDSSFYKGREIGFYKRAQITAADLHLSAQRRGETLFDNIEQLTLFADNAVPHVLYREGVLEYVPALAEKVEKGIYLPHGSAEEVEIRGCAAQGVELIARALNMRAMDVDHRLWHYSEEKKMKALKTHKTQSIFY